jgi:hypothetical protein
MAESVALPTQGTRKVFGRLLAFKGQAACGRALREVTFDALSAVTLPASQAR